MPMPLPSAPIACAILAGLCWGVGEIFTKSAINSREIGALGTLLVRAAVTLPLALAGFWVAYKFFGTGADGREPMEPPFWLTLRGVTWLKLIVGSGVLAGF